VGFCERIGRPDLIPEHHARGDAGAGVLEDVRAVMKTRTRDEWTASFADADVCLTPVHPAVDPTPPQDERRAPALGADTDRLLDEAGIDGARRQALRSAGVI
jgi:crotonobetainyl-CoA:carnitine CoA-transferase CaiB-like acyl-CoA transferase